MRVNEVQVQNEDDDPQVLEVPSADVTILGRHLTDFLDTGASVSVLGRDCRELVEALGSPVQPYFSVVRTASGEDRSFIIIIIGRLDLTVDYRGVKRTISFYLCPYLEQAAYFGIDFWRVVGLEPAVVGGIGPKPEKEAAEIHARQMELYADQEEMDEALQGPYPKSPEKQKVVEDDVDKMLALGDIEESKRPWSNRTTVVSKQGKNCFCLDARKLNALTVKDAYPLPSVDGVLSRIDQRHFISCVDLKFAFWQIELDDNSKEYTVFTVSGRPLYQFRMMPFGLYNAAQRLVRLMDRRNHDGEEQPIAFFSVKMNKHQVNCTATEKECLAAVLETSF
ncbi:uncharacterized protein LOC122625787 [Drosophila teissieri]|uniref:uncharacterized protein LOC122625787 n=1 Tax=Drosophila teissieri TaxID=7243 RepID=UPI001CB9ECA3|nr:uncharacterized protein LOC122625787 [Drosophila teissieri]